MLRIGPERRLRQSVERVGDREHDPVVHVHHIEGDEPAQDRAGDHDPDIKVDDENDETDQWSHKPLLADASSRGEATIRATPMAGAGLP